MGLTTFTHDRPSQTLRGLSFFALSETGIVQRGTVVDDSGGGGTTTWVAAGTVPCRIDPLAAVGGRETVVAGRLDDRSTHKITCPATADIDVAGRFVIAARGTFEVTAVRERTGSDTQVFEAAQVS